MSGAIPLPPIYAFMAYTARSLSSLLLPFWTLPTVCNTMFWKLNLRPICSNNVDSMYMSCSVQDTKTMGNTQDFSNIKSTQLKRAALTLTSCVESPTSGPPLYRQNAGHVNIVSTTVYHSLWLQFVCCSLFNKSKVKLMHNSNYR